MIGDNNYQKVNEDIDESYIIPNNFHPFDHYFVNYKFQIFDEVNDSVSSSDLDSRSQSESEDDLEKTFENESYFTSFGNFVKSFMKSEK